MEQSHHKIVTKSWWSKELTSSRKLLQTMFNTWRDSGFPNGDVTHHRYLFARKRFRILVKRQKNQATVNHYINIDKMKKSSPRTFWKHMRLSNPHQKMFTINGKNNTNDITSEFKEHFNHLLNTPKVDNIDNEQSNQQLIKLSKDLSQLVEPDFQFTTLDVFMAIKKLNRNKSRDPFELQAEHFINAAQDEESPFIRHLTQIINKIFHCEEIPDILCTSLIIPLVKSYQKSLADPNNYRGISLIPVLTKILESTIITKYPQLKDHNASQFGFIPHSSTIHPEILIQDTVKYYTDMSSNVYICSLDAEKAFDTCNWFKLFQKLTHKKIIPVAVTNFLIKLSKRPVSTRRTRFSIHNT